ncbi:TetR/AcrR family transcriptional regulator [Thauera phenylacetica]|mgnify:FL=1|jgi:AcrR family transcriptional regulator|uniref:TetR family transcriptional regulator n=1 Tax=Thauera phenylacetica B4P TaxID=1234382 RepID=N6ZTF5_9RHOO|nr:TetR family transcriptional regulator [Thauera phenylacetica B4P]
MARGKAPTFQLQRATILDAAAGLFAARGFHNASMAEIARECGVSKALLYHYYRDKEHILYDIAAGHVEDLLAIVAGVESEARFPRDRLERLILRFMQAYEGGRRQHVVLIQDVKFLSPEQRARIHEQERRVVHAFAAAVEAVEPGLCGATLDKAVTMALFGMMNWTFTWLRPDGALSYADMARVVTRIFLNGIAGFAAEAAHASAAADEAALP